MSPPVSSSAAGLNTNLWCVMTFKDFNLCTADSVRMSDFIDDIIFNFAKSIGYELTEYPGFNSPPIEFDPPTVGVRSLSGVLVCVKSPDDETGIVLDYWTGRMLGGRWRWNESIANIARRHGLKASEVVKLVMYSESIAFDLGDRCPKSGYPRLLESRADLRDRSRCRCLCDRCTWEEFSKMPHVAEALERQQATALFFDMLFGIFPPSNDIPDGNSATAQIREVRDGASGPGGGKEVQNTALCARGIQS